MNELQKLLENAGVKESFRTPMDVDKEASAEWREKEQQDPEDYSLEVDGSSVLLKYKDAILVDLPDEVWGKLAREYKRIQNDRPGPRGILSRRPRGL